MNPRFYFFPFAFSLFFWGLAANPALAQQAVVGQSPAINQSNVPRASAVSVQFSQPLAAGSTSGLSVYSNQRGGLRTAGTGSTSQSGSGLLFLPTYDFRPGEKVRVSVSGAVGSSSGALSLPRVYEFTTAARSSNGTLFTGSEVLVGTNPYRVVVADVDNDGDLDLLTPTFSGSSVAVRLNDGLGYFSGGSDPSVGSQPRGVAVADIDQDGDLDLLTANYNAGTASVRFNNGSGTFSGLVDVPVGSQPQFVTTADLDGDGDLDLLVANGSNSVNVGAGPIAVTIIT